jgi:hypothetical protein
MATCGLETTRLDAHGVTLAMPTIIGSDGIARQGDDVDRAKKSSPRARRPNARVMPVLDG